jgi:hypothetical protein
MPLVSSSIPNIANGVSQQPDYLRLSSQGVEQINARSSVVDGLSKRAPTVHLAKLEGITGNAYLHTINRDNTEQYSVIIEGGVIKIYDFLGNQKVVNDTTDGSYLVSSSPRSGFTSVTVADYTFVLNKDVVTTASTVLSPLRDPEALVWIKQGTYGGVYTVEIDGTEVASYQVPNGSVASHSPLVKTTQIANQIRNDLNSALSTTFDITQYGSTIWIRRKDGAAFTLGGTSPLGDRGMEIVKDKVQSFSNLPTRAVHGFQVEVAGNSGSTADNFYVEFDTSQTGTQDGIWNEAAKGGETFRMEASTLPHALVREADGSFTFKVLTWEDRLSGDEKSAPFPSFIGRKISDLFFHRNRLGITADENVIFSKAGEYYTLFRATATAVLDDDPIDVGISHVKVSILKHAVPFNETLLMFSNQTQFQLGVTTLLTPETVNINQTTEYECSLIAKPIGVGKFVYFAVKHGDYSGLREYYVDADTESEEAAEVTAHVPAYIKGTIYKIAASSNEDTLAVLTEEDQNTIYIYRYYFSNDDKLQASWSKWQFGADDKVLNCDFIESQLYIMIERADGIHLEVINLEGSIVETDWEMPILLDSKLYSNDLPLVERADIPSGSGGSSTEVTLPYTVTAADNLQLVYAPNGASKKGTLLTDFTYDNTGETTKLIVPENVVNQPFYLGKKYEMRYQFSTFLIKENDASGSQRSLSQGRLQLRGASIQYAKTGYFRVEVTPSQRGTFSYPYTGIQVGVLSNLLGDIQLSEGSFRFPITSKNDLVDMAVVNDSYLQCHLLSVDWEGYYHLRSKRV